MRRAKFNEILEECIEAVLEGRRTVDDCLSLYPQLAPELGPLLSTAIDLSQTFQIESPSWHVQERVRLRVLAAHQARIRSRNLVSGVDLTRSGHWGARHWGVLGSAAAAVVGAVFVASLMLFSGGGDSAGPNGQPGPFVTDIRQNAEKASVAYTENGEIDYESLLAIDRQTKDLLADLSDPASFENLDAEEIKKIQDDIEKTSDLLDSLPPDEPVDEETGGTVRDLKDGVSELAGIIGGVAPPTPTPPAATDTPAPTDVPSGTPAPTATPTPAPTPAPTPTKAPSPTAAPTATPAPTDTSSGSGQFGQGIAPPP